MDQRNNCLEEVRAFFRVSSEIHKVVHPELSNSVFDHPHVSYRPSVERMDSVEYVCVGDIVKSTNKTALFLPISRQPENSGVQWPSSDRL